MRVPSLRPTHHANTPCNPIRDQANGRGGSWKNATDYFWEEGNGCQGSQGARQNASRIDILTNAVSAFRFSLGIFETILQALR
jgi:hypothetical protein